MKTLVALVVLVALALVGSRRTFVTRSLPFGGRMVFTGSEFIVIGLLIGSDFLNLVDAHALLGLQPFVCVVLGWIGFLFGLQFDRHTLAHLPRGFVAISATQAVITAAVVFAGLWYLGGRGGLPTGSMLVLVAATLSASAACSGQSTLALVTGLRSRMRSRRVTALLRYVSALDPAVGVVSFGVTLSVLAPHPWVAAHLPASLQWLVMSLCLAGLTAWILVSLTLTRTSRSELGLYLVGALALASGIALYLQLSALFVNFLSGLVVANLAHIRSIRGRLIDSMVRGERFLYILLLVLAGAYWRLPPASTLGVAAAYLLLRLAGKTAGAYIATRRLTRHHPVPAGVGLGLISQAGMGLAIVVEIQLVVGGSVGDLVAGVAIPAIILNELMAPWLAMAVVAPGAESPP